ncbi:protein of unknown function (plasmid) [Caballeronia sp. S22]
MAASAERTPANEAAATALPSWRDDAARPSILKFIADVTHEGSATYVPLEARIAGSLITMASSGASRLCRFSCRS